MTAITKNTPPSSPEAEEAVLGAILLEPTVMLNVVEIIQPADFYHPQNEAIYRVLLDMWTNDKAIDILTLQEVLKQRSLLDKIGGLVYLDQLFDSVPASENAPHYAKIVRETSNRRKLMDACREGYQGAKNTKDFQDVLDMTSDKVLGISLDVTRRAARSFKDVIPEYKKKLRHSVENPDADPAYFPTGIPGVDKIMTGLAPGMFDIMAAKPNIGKTAISLQIADYAAYHGHPVVFISLEMSETALIGRIIARHLKIDSRKFIWRELNEAQMARVEKLKLEGLPFVIEDKIFTLQQIWNRCRFWQHQFGGLGLVVVDYIQQVSGYGKIYEKVSAITRSLKDLARRLDCAVLGVSQIGRKGELEGSGVLDQAGDRIIVMDLDGKDQDKYNQKIKLFFKKNKHGVAGATVRLRYITRFGQFVDGDVVQGVSKVVEPDPRLNLDDGMVDDL